MYLVLWLELEMCVRVLLVVLGLKSKRDNVEQLRLGTVTGQER